MDQVWELGMFVAQWAERRFYKGYKGYKGYLVSNLFVTRYFETCEIIDGELISLIASTLFQILNFPLLVSANTPCSHGS